MLPNPIFLNVHMYGVMIAVGLLCCFIVLFTYSKKMGIDTNFVDFVFYTAIVAILVGFGAATLFQTFYNYLDSGVWRWGGMTFLGGLIGGVVSFLIIYAIFKYGLKREMKLYRILSLVPCCILVAHGFGRIGCFFAGCCYGIPTDSFLGVKFPNLPHAVHPTMLYEAAFLFIMFAVCSFLLLKYGFRHNLSLYLLSYGVFRFLIEYIRGDERGEFFLEIFSPSQIQSLIMILLCVPVFLLVEYFYHIDGEKSVFDKKLLKK